MRILIVAAFCVATSQAVNTITVESVVRGAADIFATEYFDARIGASVSAEIKRRLESGQYAALQTNQDLADRLTSDLSKLTGDKHVALRLRRPAGGSTGSAQRRDAPTAAGFRRTDILPGNSVCSISHSS